MKRKLHSFFKKKALCVQLMLLAASPLAQLPSARMALAVESESPDDAAIEEALRRNGTPSPVQQGKSAEGATADESAGKVHRLEGVQVRGQTEQPGEILIDRRTMDMTPSATNSINDLLRGQSNVQFDSSSRSGMLGGEITPPKISIRGAKHYENNFIINGLGNNNRINPGGYEHTGNAAIPSGDSQSIMLSTDMLDTVKVYTENVPAKYGDFLGGVIDAKLRDAASDRWRGMAAFRYTDSNLTQFHYTSSDSKAQPLAGNNYQPEFYKYYPSLRLEGPLWQNGPGVMMAYTNTTSIIPLKLKAGDGSVTERRLNENYLFKINTPESSPLYLSLTTIYAPYKATLYNANFKDGGEYSVNSGGVDMMLNSHYDFPIGRWSNDITYSKNNLDRKNSKDVNYVWKVSPSTKSWAYSNNLATEGGYGNYLQQQTTLSWASSMDFKAFGPKYFTHQLETGFELKKIMLESEREGYTVFTNAALAGGASGSYGNGVITGEQYAKTKQVYNDLERRESVFAPAFYLQDTIKIERVTIRPGARVSYDSLTENTDVAPRFFVNVDLLNDNRFNVFGGYNRYYGTQVMERALRGSSFLQTFTRSNWNSPWVAGAKTPPGAFRLGSLKTPYNDEYTFGASADVWDTLFKATYVKRDYRNQLKGAMVKEDGVSYTQYCNDGKTDYKGITLSAERTFDFGDWGKHTGELSATWSKTEGNYTDWTNASYNETDNVLRDPNFVLLNGVVTPIGDMPASNFNSPWVIAYTHSAQFWEDRLRLMGQLRWEQGGKRLYNDSDSTNVVGPSGLLLSSYRTAYQEDSLNVDAKLSFDAIKYKDQTLTLEVEALNLLDRKNLSNLSTTATSQGTYALGRQFYFGVKYTF